MNPFAGVMGSSGAAPRDGAVRADSKMDRVDAEGAAAFAAALGRSLAQVESASERLPRGGTLGLLGGTETPVEGAVLSREDPGSVVTSTYGGDDGGDGSGSTTLRPSGVLGRPDGGSSEVVVRGTSTAVQDLARWGSSQLPATPAAQPQGSLDDPGPLVRPESGESTGVPSRGPGPVGRNRVSAHGSVTSEGEETSRSEGSLASNAGGGSGPESAPLRVESRRIAGVRRSDGQALPREMGATGHLHQSAEGRSVPEPTAPTLGEPSRLADVLPGDRHAVVERRAPEAQRIGAQSTVRVAPPGASAPDAPSHGDRMVTEAGSNPDGPVPDAGADPDPAPVAGTNPDPNPDDGTSGRTRTVPLDENPGARAASPLEARPLPTPTGSEGVARAKVDPPSVGGHHDVQSTAFGLTHETLAGDTIQARTRASRGPDRNLQRLDPRLRSAVGRVLERLENEHGIDADIVEGYRSASRQRSLYAQGRTEPGRVVTWTLDSAHMRGRAVDLVLNQQWDDLAPYRTLQEVAAEEGLKTLGMKDPGHLELPVPGQGRRSDLSAQGGPPVRRTLARAASIAGVAGRASVARAASPAVPGVTVRSTGATPSLEKAPAPAPEAPAPPAPDPIPQAPDPIPTPVPVEVPRSEVAALSGEATPSLRGGEAKAEPPTAVGGPVPSGESGPRAGQGLEPSMRTSSLDMTSRVEQVRQVQDAAELSRSGTSVDLGEVDGLGTRVRLNLRGGKVGARIDAVDPKLGAVLEERGPMLKSALEARGLETDAIQIRTVPDEAGSLRSANKTVEAVHVGESARDGRDRPRDTSPEHKGSRQEPRPDDFRQRREREEGRDDR